MLLLLATSLAASRPQSPPTIYVNTSDNLTLVIHEAPDFAEIVFADGNYTPQTDADNGLVVTKSITLRAANRGQAVIDGRRKVRGIQIRNGVGVLAGLNFTNGMNDFRAAGVSIIRPKDNDSRVEIIDCNIYDNVCTPEGWGGGVEIFVHPNVSIRDSTIRGNRGRFGGG
jgi:hypothetical protein